MHATAIASYLGELVTRLHLELGDDLVGVWQFGSGALGDFDPLRSDLDVQAVTARRLPTAVRDRIVARLSHPTLGCPVRGLELVLYARDDLAAASYQLNLNTGPRMRQHASQDPREDPAFWFVIDLAIGREHGRPLFGPAPAEVIPPFPRQLIASSLREALRFWTGPEGSAAQAVLAACRAWAWAVDGVWLSKGAAAEWARERLADPGPVDRAQAARAGLADEPHADAVAAVLHPALLALADSRADSPGSSVAS
jgi:hypothetical protein